MYNPEHMSDLSELSRSDVFEMYEVEAFRVAEEVADEMEGDSRHDALDGREWCEDNDVPEYVFSDAVEWYLENVDYGVSPLYPFPTRPDEEVVAVRDVEEEDEEKSEDEEETEEVEEETEETEEEDAEEEDDDE